MPERIQLRRVKGWRKPPDAVVVARPSKWGNPYRPSDYTDDYPGATDHRLRYMATSDYRGLVIGSWDRLEGTPPAHVTVDEIRAELRGKDLACWCPPDQPCHADVLLEIANTTGRVPRKQP